MTSVLVAVAVVFFLGQGLKGLFARVRLPEAGLFLVAGYVVGPVLGWFPETEWNRYSIALCEFSLALILYLTALQLSVRDAFLRHLSVVALVVLGSATALGAGIVFGSLFQPFFTAVYAGVCLMALGAGPVRSFLSGNRAGKGVEGVWEREASWSEGLAAALGVALLAGYEKKIFDPSLIAISEGAWLGKSLALGLGSGLAWVLLDRRAPAFTRARFATEAWWVLTFAAAEKAGFSGAFAGFVLGWVQAQLAPGPRWLSTVVSFSPVTAERVPALVDTWQVLTNLFWIRLGTELRFGNVNLLLFSMMVLGTIWTARYLWVFVAINPKRFSRWEAMSLFASSPRGLGALALATIPVAFPNSASGWVLSAVGLTVFFSLFASTAFLALVNVPNVRVRAHKIFGRYKEDFGVADLKAAADVSESEAPLEQTALPVSEIPEVVEAAPVALPPREAAPVPRTSFPELKAAAPAESDLEDESHEDWKEPTLTNQIDLTSLEDDPDGKRKVG
jgi:hypothetical protein